MDSRSADARPSTGQMVLINEGILRGLTGKLVQDAGDGRVVVQLELGLYARIPRTWLEGISEPVEEF